MSDNWVILVPEDPAFVPDSNRRERAHDRFEALAPDADEIEITVAEHPRFFDCGCNLSRIACPDCGADIADAWWQERLAADVRDDDGFHLAAQELPCCGTSRTLNELVYDWPQAFGCFALDAMNPNLGRLADSVVLEFEEILGTKLRVIYQHL